MSFLFCPECLFFLSRLRFFCPNGRLLILSRFRFFCPVVFLLFQGTHGWILQLSYEKWKD